MPNNNIKYDSVIINKGIEKARSQRDMFGEESLSEEQRRLLDWDQTNYNNKVIDMTLSFGPGAIQKLGDGQVYGKVAKAVRKALSRFKNSSLDNPDAKVTDLWNVKWVDDYGRKMYERNVTTFSSNNLNNGSYAGQYNASKKGNDALMMVRNDLPSKTSDYVKLHEVGHTFDVSAPHITKAQKMGGYIGEYEMYPNEIMAESFAIRKFLDRGIDPMDVSVNKELTQNAYKLLNEYPDFWKNINIKRYK